MSTPAPRELARSDAGLSLAGVPRVAARKTLLIAVTVAIAAAGVALAVAGGMLALGMVRTGRDAQALQRDASLALRGPAAIGEDVRTSFGVVAVESMTKSAGPTAKALAGVTHGIQSLVPPDKVQVLTTVTITNTTRSVIRYTPAQFLLYATRGAKPGPGRPADPPHAGERPSGGAPAQRLDRRDARRTWRRATARGSGCRSATAAARTSGPHRPRTHGPHAVGRARPVPRAPLSTGGRVMTERLDRARPAATWRLGAAGGGDRHDARARLRRRSSG